MAKDSAEKGLSEEAVKLFDLAKVHVTLAVYVHLSPFILWFCSLFHATLFYFDIAESRKSIGNLKQALESSKLLHLSFPQLVVHCI